tara:strand:- start:1207 stop:2280 length:1074 start_codon:yes stop_codon:yes gene_type:complete
MRYELKTSHAQDVKLFRDRGTKRSYAALAILVISAPLLTDDYGLSQLSFVYIYAIVGVGMMLLSGFTGLISLGHAAFFAAGAYTTALLEKNGLDFALTLPAAAVLAGFLGLLVGLPSLRLTGIYLTIATLAFAFIVEEVLARWQDLTGGNDGLLLDDAIFLGITIDSEVRFYYLAAGLLTLSLLLAANILRAPLGRAMIAVRDSETAAYAMGINVAFIKTATFSVSAALTGVAGALYAHKLTFISPEQFTIFLSIEFLLIVIIGGLGSLHGAVFGAIFVIILPQIVMLFRDFLPTEIANLPGLETAAFGLVLILFILFEPLGLYGIWRKVLHYGKAFPFYKKNTFKREKSFLRGESN